MKVIAINGSPRKMWSTDALLKAALEGAASTGADTKMIYLYDLKFTGCKSCMVCKLKNGASIGRCAIKDDLKPVLDEVHDAAALILGSPIYWHDVTGMMRCFLERLLFQYLNYDDYNQPLSPRKSVAMIYAMNMAEKKHEEWGYSRKFAEYEELLRHFFHSCTTMYATETLQVKDYNLYHMGGVDGHARQLRHETVFPQDCQKAYALGAALATAGGANPL